MSNKYPNSAPRAAPGATRVCLKLTKNGPKNSLSSEFYFSQSLTSTTDPAKCYELVKKNQGRQYIISLAIGHWKTKKLNGVGPVDNRPFIN